jgi:ABC-type uncharacterized transport system substrate-binding protein
MKRRAFISLLGGAAAWPIAARAQQTGKLPTIGFLGTINAPAWEPWTAAFMQRLREHGWIEGRNVAFEVRWAEGRRERFAEIAAEFVRLKVNIIVTAGLAAVTVKQTTSDIPIVFALASDPVGTGLVASLARPGGNVTGLSFQSTDLAGKRLAFLREVLPALHALAILTNSGNAASVEETGQARAAARATPGTAFAAQAAKAATASVPIVFAVGDDPVKLGLVASIARSGGNLTGVNFLNTELVAKQFGLLRELLPQAARVAVLVNNANATAEPTLRAVEAAARVTGVAIQPINASTTDEIRSAFAGLGHERPDALFVGGDGLFTSRRVQLVNLASHHSIPATYADRIFPEIGGLMSYGSDLQQPTKFELVINLKTAKALGLTVPDKLLALTDEVIE